MMKNFSLLVLSLMLSSSGYASLEPSKELEEVVAVVVDEVAQEEFRKLVVEAVLHGKLTQTQAEQILVHANLSEKTVAVDTTKRYFAAGVVAGLALIGGGYCVYRMCTAMPKNEDAGELIVQAGQKDVERTVEANVEPTEDVVRARSNSVDSSSSTELDDTEVDMFTQEIPVPPAPQCFLPESTTDVTAVFASEIDQLFRAVPALGATASGQQSPVNSVVSDTSTNVSKASRCSSRLSVQPDRFGSYATPEQLKALDVSGKPSKRTRK